MNVSRNVRVFLTAADLDAVQVYTERGVSRVTWHTKLNEADDGRAESIAWICETLGVDPYTLTAESCVPCAAAGEILRRREARR